MQQCICLFIDECVKLLVTTVSIQRKERGVSVGLLYMWVWHLPVTARNYALMPMPGRHLR